MENTILKKEYVSLCCKVPISCVKKRSKAGDSIANKMQNLFCLLSKNKTGNASRKGEHMEQPPGFALTWGQRYVYDLLPGYLLILNFYYASASTTAMTGVIMFLGYLSVRPANTWIQYHKTQKGKSLLMNWLEFSLIVKLLSRLTTCW